jgi:hypothetical protein
MGLRYGYVGSTEVSKRILDRLSLDPTVVVSFDDEHRDRIAGFATYEEYEEWITVDSINDKETLRSYDLDILLVMAWQELLDAEALGINVIQANVLAAEGDVTGEVFNVACGGRVTVNELVETLNALLGTDLDPIYDDPRPGDVRHSHADVSKACDLLGYEPGVSFEAGLQRTVEFYREP